MVGEVLLEQVGVLGKYHDDGAGEPLHVAPPDVRVLALQLLQHLEALSQLREHVNHRVGEVGVLRVLLELLGEKRRFCTERVLPGGVPLPKLY